MYIVLSVLLTSKASHRVLLLTRKGTHCSVSPDRSAAHWVRRVSSCIGRRARAPAPAAPRRPRRLVAARAGAAGHHAAPPCVAGRARPRPPPRRRAVHDPRGPGRARYPALHLALHRCARSLARLLPPPRSPSPAQHAGVRLRSFGRPPTRAHSTCCSSGFAALGGGTPLGCGRALRQGADAQPEAAWRRPPLWRQGARLVPKCRRQPQRGMR